MPEPVEKPKAAPTEAPRDARGAEAALNALKQSVSLKDPNTENHLNVVQANISELKENREEDLSIVYEKVGARRGLLKDAIRAAKEEEKDEARAQELEKERERLGKFQNELEKKGVNSRFLEVAEGVPRNVVRFVDKAKNWYVAHFKENPFYVGGITLGAALLTRYLFSPVKKVVGTGLGVTTKVLAILGVPALLYTGFRWWGPESAKKWIGEKLPKSWEKWWNKEMGLLTDEEKKEVQERAKDVEVKLQTQKPVTDAAITKTKGQSYNANKASHQETLNQIETELDLINKIDAIASDKKGAYKQRKVELEKAKLDLGESIKNKTTTIEVGGVTYSINIGNDGSLEINNSGKKWHLYLVIPKIKDADLSKKVQENLKEVKQVGNSINLSYTVFGNLNTVTLREADLKPLLTQLTSGNPYEIPKEKTEIPGITFK